MGPSTVEGNATCSYIMRGREASNFRHAAAATAATCAALQALPSPALWQRSAPTCGLVLPAQPTASSRSVGGGKQPGGTQLGANTASTAVWGSWATANGSEGQSGREKQPAGRCAVHRPGPCLGLACRHVAITGQSVWGQTQHPSVAALLWVCNLAALLWVRDLMVCGKM